MHVLTNHSVSAFGSSTGTLTGTSGICILASGLAYVVAKVEIEAARW